MPEAVELPRRLDLLQRHLDLAEGFALLIAVASSPFRRLETASQLLARNRPRAIWIALQPGMDSLLEVLPAPGGEGPPIAVVTGLENVIPARRTPAGGAFLEALNVNREVVARRHAGPLVLLVPDYLVARLARLAPDFFSVRSGVFFLERRWWFVPWLVELPVLREASAVRLLPRSVREAEAEETLQALKSMEEAGRPMPPALLERGGRLLSSLGRRQEALELLRRPVDGVGGSPDLVRRALEWRGVGGDLDDAALVRHTRALLRLRRCLATAEVLRDMGALEEAEALLSTPDEDWDPSLDSVTELALRAMLAGIVLRRQGALEASKYWMGTEPLRLVSGVEILFGPETVREARVGHSLSVRVGTGNWEVSVVVSLLLALDVARQDRPGLARDRGRVDQLELGMEFPTLAANLAASLAVGNGLEEAWRRFDQALEKSLRSSEGVRREVLSLRGQTCLMLGDPRSAARWLSRAVRLEPVADRLPDLSVDHLALALAWEALGLRRRAAPCARRAVRLARCGGSPWRLSLVRGLLSRARRAPGPPLG